MRDCSLCGEMRGELRTTAHWRVVLNYNQDRLGKCFLVLDRHDEDVCNLTTKETNDLWVGLRRVKAALTACFGPEHFNYMFLMNQDRHVHLHMIPRYRTPRTFADVDFPVLDSLDGGRYIAPDPILEQIAGAIRQRLALLDAPPSV
jgi:diadenosine tetraphosphate (Ap4A) HIT family hydrolase